MQSLLQKTHQRGTTILHVDVGSCSECSAARSEVQLFSDECEQLSCRILKLSSLSRRH